MTVWDTLTAPEHRQQVGIVVGPYNVGAQAITNPGIPGIIDFASADSGAFIPLGWLLLINSSPYALNVAQGVTLKILPAFTADLFRVAILPNTDPVSWLAFPPLAGTPQAGQDTSLYATWYDTQPSGVYPCAVAAAAAYAVPPPAGQGVIVCTSTTRPTGPTQGMQIYELDTQRTLIWQGASIGWTPPWNVPWGPWAAQATTTANVSTATVNVVSAAAPGSSTSITLPAARRVVADVITFMQATAAGLAASTFVFMDNARWTTQSLTQYFAASGGPGALSVGGRLSAVVAAGPHIFDLRCSFAAGTGTLYVLTGSTLLVGDDGPT